LFVSLSAANLAAQSSEEVPESGLFKHISARRLLHDQKAIWTSPSRVKQSDTKWLMPIAAATAFAFAKDDETSRRLESSQDLRNASLTVSNAGKTYVVMGASGALYGLGKLTHNERLAKTGLLAIEAGIGSQVAIQSLKVLASRTRPDEGGGGFWNGGNSFPSGHAASTWALAKVVADRYKEKPLIKIGAYTFATAVSVSRVTGQRHYASDVIVGSTIGYLIGKYITHRDR
jgi:hypothetical protein